MSRLMIVGAGGFGREVYGWVRQTLAFLEQHGIEQIGFVDDNLSALERWPGYPQVTITLEQYQPQPEDRLLCSIGNPLKRREVVGVLKERGAHFVSFVHAQAVLGEGVTMGEGAILCPFSVVTCDVHIGSFFILNVSSSVGHDVHIGDFVTFSAHCDATGGVTIGHDCMLGSGSRIIPSVSLGSGVKVGAGSVVVRNVKENQSVFGVPAKPLPRRFP